MTGLTYRPELDGVRSIAVYLVVCFHAGMVTLGGGFIGVDLFFVLSGFLVTAVILNEVDQQGTFDLGGFYSRRVRRLLPAAVVVIVVTAAFQLLVASLPARLDLINDARASLLYFANWHFITETRDYFAADAESSPFLHFWSLAIEEQFYIAFPLLVLLVLRVSRRPLRLLAVALVALTGLSVALQVWRAASDASYAYYATETRMYQLAVGALLTLAVRRATSEARSGLRAAGTPLAVAGVVTLALVASRWVDVTPSVRGLLATVASASLILGLWWARDGWLTRLLALPAPRYLGQVSYGTYLWHWPVLLVVQQVFAVRPLVIAAIGAAIATGLAVLSYTLLEHPIRRAPSLVKGRWVTVAAGLTASIVAAVAVVPPLLETDRRPALNLAAEQPARSNAPDLDRPVPEDVDLTAAAEDLGPSVPVCTTSDLDACTLVEGTGDHLLLLGDSQARMYIPALKRLAREKSLTLSANVVAGCAWQAGQVNLRDGEDDQAACQRAREDFIEDVLPEMDVDVVLAVGLSRSEGYWEDQVGSTDGGNESLDELHIRTTRQTAEAIASAGSDLVIASSTYGTNGYRLNGFDPIECLASATKLGECAVTPPREQPAVDGAYAVLATEMSSVHNVDFNPAICPNEPVCAPIIDGTVVWRDSNHVTTEILTQHRGKLWKRLAATGAFDQE